jgi:hypothetical protein
VSDERRFEVLAADEMTALDVGRAVQEGEFDAEVRAHPYLPPGHLVLIDRSLLRPFEPMPVEFWDSAERPVERQAMTDKLAAFITARVDELAVAAHGCMNCGQPIRRAMTKTGYTHGRAGLDWQGSRCPGKLTGALPWPDPERLLRRVEAVRNILARYGGCLVRMEDPDYSHAVARDQAREYEDFVLPNLAAEWSEHPNYAAAVAG